MRSTIKPFIPPACFFGGALGLSLADYLNLNSPLFESIAVAVAIIGIISLGGSRFFTKYPLSYSGLKRMKMGTGFGVIIGCCLYALPYYSSYVDWLGLFRSIGVLLIIINSGLLLMATTDRNITYHMYY